MLFGVILALICGTAVSAPWNGERNPQMNPWYGEHSRGQQRNPWGEASRHHQMNPWHGESSRHHQMNPNPFGSSSLTQGFLCDWCVVGVEDFQEKLSMNKGEILAILNRTSALCDYCPARELCQDFFRYEIPGTIDDILAQAPEDMCIEAGLCNENASLPGLVMTGLDSHIARDRLIKRMLKRASALQRNMIRMIMGPDYMCDACHDLLRTTRQLLTNNDTQQLVVQSLAPVCDYMPDVFQADCDEFIQSIPFLMDMLANEVLLDSTCNELGLCNTTRKDPVVDTLPDIISQLGGQLGITDILEGIGQGRNPFELPGGDRQNPGFQFPGFGREQPDRNPFGIPNYPNPQAPFGAPIHRPGNPYGNSRPETRPGHHHSGRPRPETPYGKWPTSTNTRPEKPQRPYKPRPRPTEAPEPLIPDLNLEELGAGILDQIPDLPQLPKIRLQGINLNFPGFRYRRDLEKIKALKIDLAEPMDKVLEYVPDAIPEAGIPITPEMPRIQNTEDCEVCKMAVNAVKSWLQDNEMEIQRMAMRIVQPFCEYFPSPMKEDCTSDVTEFVQTFVKNVITRLVPDKICSTVGLCDTAVDVPPEAPLPTVDAAAPAQPTTWPLLP